MSGNSIEDDIEEVVMRMTMFIPQDTTMDVMFNVLIRINIEFIRQAKADSTKSAEFYVDNMSKMLRATLEGMDTVQ